MADVDDKWHKLVDGKKVRTDQYGRGKRWRARWRDESGIQRQESFDTKADADRHVATVKADMLRRTYIDPNAGRVTFKAYAERWRARQIHRESTRVAVETYLRRHTYPVFGDRPIATLKPSDIQAWVRGLESGGDDRAPLMPGTVQVIFSFVSAVFHAAVRDKVIATSPAVNISRTKPTKKRAVPPTREQLSVLREKLPARHRALVAVGGGCGLRQGEALGLELDCVDFLRRQLTVRQQLVSLPGELPFLAVTKTPLSARTVPLAEVVLNELAEHVRQWPPRPVTIWDRTNKTKPVEREALLLFVGDDGTPMSRSNFSHRLWQPTRAAAGMPAEFTFHDLRHFYASALIRYGESVKTVQARLGHSSALETLDTYGHLWPDSEDRSRAAVEDAFKVDVGGSWAESSG